MTTKPLMQQALGDAQWAQLPPALQAHYQQNDNRDVGALDIDYPALMQPYLHFLRLFGALLNRRGKGIATTVAKHMEGDTQCWKRTVTFPDGKTLLFQSRWQYGGGNEVVEYVSPIMGLRMAVSVVDGKLHYSGKHLVLKLGSVLIPIPEWLVLGHTTIVETALDDSSFAMDFRLTHPWFGEVYRYAGTFRTEAGG